jgi:hypothetical protein
MTGTARIASLLILTALLMLAAVSLAGAPRVEAAPPDNPECATGVELLGFSDALDKETYEETNVGGLSGLAHAGVDAYYSVVDNEGDTPARLYTVEAPVGRDGLGAPEIEDVTFLRDASGEPFTGADFDGEGIVLERDGDLLISSETEPSIRRFSPGGELLGELPVPQKFLVAPEGEGRTNQTFESLDLSPTGHSLFTANEGYLAADGETADGSDRIRILRYERQGREDFKPAEEFYYLAGPGQGVVEILAVSESELLVLERGFISGEGNTVRVFRVSLDGAEGVSDEPTLAAPGLEPLEKEIVVDLGECPPSGAESPGTQQNPLLDNFEAMELGPRLSGGGRSLLLVSDDNFNGMQVTRVVALGLYSTHNRGEE